MDLQTFINIASEWRDEGNAVTDQLSDVLEGNIEGCNPNALKRIVRFLSRSQTRENITDAEDVAEEINLFLAREN